MTLYALMKGEEMKTCSNAITAYQIGYDSVMFYDGKAMRTPCECPDCDKAYTEGRAKAREDLKRKNEGDK